jgi:hypothetical protein
MYGYMEGMKEVTPNHFDSKNEYVCQGTCLLTNHEVTLRSEVIG